MFKRVLLAAAATVALASAPASAVTLVSTTGSAAQNTTFAGYVNTNVFTFDSFSQFSDAGFTTTPNTSTGSVQIVQGSLPGQYLAPTGSQGNRYLAVLGGGSFTASKSTPGFSLISFYLGSVDTYNSVEILGTSGQVLATYTGTQLAAGAPNGSTGFRVTFTSSANDASALGGLRITSTSNSAELDNLVFAVPEPSTWALMLAGFGMVGMAMRSRRRRTSVVFG